MIDIALSNILSDNVVTLLAAFLGFLGGVFSRIAKYWFEKRTRTKKLRLAALNEIKSPKKAINSLNNKTIDDELHFGHTIPTKIYESHTSDIGLLSSSEVECLVEYYSIANVANEQLESLSEDSGSIDIQTFLNQTVAGLKGSRDEAEKTLSSHTKWLGKYRYKIKSVICG